jgi:hypothetical protein
MATDTSTGQDRSGRLKVPEWLWWTLPLLAAVAVRAYRLPGQILTGDEWHALDRAMHLPYRQLLSSFGFSDHSIALALYFKAAMDTLGLGDVLLRAPFLLAGVVSVLLIGWTVRPHVGPFAACTLAWLMALSPILIFYGRTARPYALTLLAAWGGAFAFLEWWTNGGKRWAAVFWACAVLTGWLLVIVLPFVLGSFVFAALTLRRPRPPALPGLRELAGVGLATAAALAALLLPALITDFWSLSGATGPVERAGFTIREGLAALQVLAGAAGPPGCTIVVLLAGLGGWAAFRRAPRLTAFVSLLSVLQVAAIYVALPAGTGHNIILARYLLPVLPALLLFAATGTEALASLGPPGVRRALRIGLGAALVAGLFAAGPAPAALTGPANWVSHQLYVSFWYGPGVYPRLVRRVPDFYRSLAARPPATMMLVEVPSHTFSVTNPMPYYQGVHRQRSLVGFHNGLCGRLRKGEVPWGRTDIRLRNYVFVADPEGTKRAGAAYVVFHRRLSREMSVQPFAFEEPDLSGCMAAYRSWFGPAVYEDEDVVVFDVRSVIRPPGGS